MRVHLGFICAVLFIAFYAFAAWFVTRGTCNGQCAHGDKDCQEMCFKKGECPFGWKP